MKRREGLIDMVDGAVLYGSAGVSLGAVGILMDSVSFISKPSWYALVQTVLFVMGIFLVSISLANIMGIIAEIVRGAEGGSHG